MTTWFRAYGARVFCCGVLGASALTPSFVSAAELYFKVVPSSVPNDEAAIVEAYVRVETQEVNAIEGMVRFEESAGARMSSLVVETGGSEASLWPTPPKYDERDRTIRFAGGSPTGFKNNGLLFRMRIFASSPGALRLFWHNTAAYRSDGKGTKEPVSARSLALSIAKGAPNAISAASHDSTPPAFTAIEVGRDTYTHEGKYFVSFHATDNASGVTRYEVRERGFVTEVSNGVYILKDQERKARVDITVYDGAGNSKSVQVPRPYQWTLNAILAVGAVVALIICVGWYVYSRRRANLV